jgi:hypothetical protein
MIRYSERNEVERGIFILRPTLWLSQKTLITLLVELIRVSDLIHYQAETQIKKAAISDSLFGGGVEDRGRTGDLQSHNLAL